MLNHADERIGAKVRKNFDICKYPDKKSARLTASTPHKTNNKSNQLWTVEQTRCKDTKIILYLQILVQNFRFKTFSAQR